MRIIAAEVGNKTSPIESNLAWLPICKPYHATNNQDYRRKYHANQGTKATHQARYTDAKSIQNGDCPKKNNCTAKSHEFIADEFWGNQIDKKCCRERKNCRVPDYIAQPYDAGCKKT